MSKRTQLYFPEELLQKVKEEAEKEGVSMAEVVRVAVMEYLERKKRVDWDKDPVWSLIGRVESDRGDLSSKHDHYLYEGEGK